MGFFDNIKRIGKNVWGNVKSVGKNVYNVTRDAVNIGKSVVKKAEDIYGAVKHIPMVQELGSKVANVTVPKLNMTLKDIGKIGKGVIDIADTGIDVARDLGRDVVDIVEGGDQGLKRVATRSRDEMLGLPNKFRGLIRT